MTRLFLSCSLLALSFSASAYADVIYNVTLNTAALQTDSADQPFYLAFELADGSGLGDGNNAAIFSNFQLGGGSASLPTVTFGNGVTGDLSSMVQMVDVDSFEYFSQPFTPGSQIGFQLELTTNVDSPSPDELLFWVLDSSQTPIPTLASDGLDTLAEITIDSSSPTVAAFASDPSRLTFGGQSLAMDAPSVTPAASTPEPAMALPLGLALAGILIRARRRAAPKP